MDEEENGELKDPHYYRGLFISKFSMVELFMDAAICFYFTRDEEMAKDLIFMVINRLTFESKRTAFKAILEKISIADGFKKTKNNKWPYSELLNEIRLLNDHRIYFAHYAIFGGKSTDENVIELMEYRDQKKRIIYSKAEYYKLIKRLGNVISQVMKIQTEKFNR
ncbi:MAG TPA: hypothetical protein VNX40_00315 [Mucilaginibacter sp.]|jgi:hypothetical protein|nr:hypothetical protein [Mucilaginibacter sp.]